MKHYKTTQIEVCFGKEDSKKKSALSEGIFSDKKKKELYFGCSTLAERERKKKSVNVAKFGVVNTIYLRQMNI